MGFMQGVNRGASDLCDRPFDGGAGRIDGHLRHAVDDALHAHHQQPGAQRERAGGPGEAAAVLQGQVPHAQRQEPTAQQQGGEQAEIPQRLGDRRPGEKAPGGAHPDGGGDTQRPGHDEEKRLRPQKDARWRIHRGLAAQPDEFLPDRRAEKAHKRGKLQGVAQFLFRRQAQQQQAADHDHPQQPAPLAFARRGRRV